MSANKNIYYGLNDDFKLIHISPIDSNWQQLFKEIINLLKQNNFKIKNQNSKKYTLDIFIKNNWETWFLGRVVPYGIPLTTNWRVQIKPNNSLINKMLAVFFVGKLKIFLITDKNVSTNAVFHSSLSIKLEKMMYWKQFGDFIYKHETKIRKSNILVFSNLNILHKIDLNNFDNLKIWEDESKLKIIKNDIETQIKFLNEKRTATLNQAKKEGYIANRIIIDQKLRKKTLERYNNKCLITNISNPEILENAHVKPKSVSLEENKIDEITDYQNCILFSPTFHRLFDVGLISFDYNCQLIYSSKLTGYTKTWIKNQINNKNYQKIICENVNLDRMKYHRKNIFKK